jgi:TctA family transporter
VFDVGVMLVCGIMAYFMEANDIPVAPAILGIVLGRLLEDSFMVSMIKSDWDLTVFFQRPVSAVLGVITVILWSGPFIAAFRKWRRDVKDADAENKTCNPNIDDVV